MFSSITLIAGSILLISLLSCPLLLKVIFFIIIEGAGAYYLSQFGLYFIGLSYMIVYIGAIAILFLFIIMIYSPSISTTTATTTTTLRYLPFLTVLY